MPDKESLSENISLPATTSRLTRADRWDHFMARVGVKRMGHIVQPGLYTLGQPSPDSPVFVSANYTLSFDALRSAWWGSMLTSWCWTLKGQRVVRRRRRYLRHPGAGQPDRCNWPG